MYGKTPLIPVDFKTNRARLKKRIPEELENPHDYRKKLVVHPEGFEPPQDAV
jgi:hypothetical protein